jgi:hypothetical protein
MEKTLTGRHLPAVVGQPAIASFRIERKKSFSRLQD